MLKQKTKRSLGAIALGLSLTATQFAVADELDVAQVRFVTATQSSDGIWCFATTVEHNDQGWKHYADEWRIESTSGETIGVRELAHPHDNEQPFTRSLCGVNIPPTQQVILVKTKCNLHGYGEAVKVDLSKTQGELFEVKRQ